MNPFEQKAKSVEKYFKSWSNIYPYSYNKNDVDPYTKTRIILMNGTEFEACGFSHQFARHIADNELRRELAVTRRIEQQQQKILATLKPIDESILETTISYEQLAVDLTAILAQREPCSTVKMALDFALLEDFDHLYRYANLLDMDKGIKSDSLVGGYTEIMPGRPTISEHRFPYDNVKPWISFKDASPITKLNISIITAAEQQTMNYYMNVAGFYQNDIGRKLYQEIGLIEEQHVSQYESLADPESTFLECLLMHQYTECYLYYSCYEDEKNPKIKELWEMMLEEEISHLHKAQELLKKYENKTWEQVIPNGEFPELLSFHDNIDYIRNVIKETVGKTSVLDNYPDLDTVPDDAKFFEFQKAVNPDASLVPSHMVIDKYIKEKSTDYRYQTAEHPIAALRDRTKDNASLARVKQAVKV